MRKIYISPLKSPLFSRIFSTIVATALTCNLFSQNIGINTDGTPAEIGVMLDVKAPNAKGSSILQTYLQLKSNDVVNSELKLRLGFKTDVAQVNRYGFLDFLEAGTPTYLPLALQPTGRQCRHRDNGATWAV